VRIALGFMAGNTAGVLARASTFGDQMKKSPKPALTAVSLPKSQPEPSESGSSIRRPDLWLLTFGTLWQIRPWALIIRSSTGISAFGKARSDFSSSRGALIRDHRPGL
jgi:hypothetical protein